MKKKLLTILLTFALLFSLSFTCSATDYVLNGKYYIQNSAYTSDISIKSVSKLTFTDSSGNTLKYWLSVNNKGKLYWYDAVGNGNTIKDEYISFDNQTVDVDFYNAFIKAYPPPRVYADDLLSVLDNATEQISVLSVVGVLAFIVLAVVGLVFMWWGVRKTIRAVMSAFKKGKISV